LIQGQKPKYINRNQQQKYHNSTNSVMRTQTTSCVSPSSSRANSFQSDDDDDDSSFSDEYPLSADSRTVFEAGRIPVKENSSRQSQYNSPSKITDLLDIDIVGRTSS